ncbi:MAG: thioredoxin family protein [Verrucomicrobiaceae bacterium]|nr:MAG: thioredoxin family protein [Verrucomicrobiaceae bacterium]
MMTIARHRQRPSRRQFVPLLQRPRRQRSAPIEAALNELHSERDSAILFEHPKGRFVSPLCFNKAYTMKTRLKQFVAAFVALAASTALAAEGWVTDYEKALQQAKQENKKVLLDFTGSDWCGWCIKLQEDVFSKPEFKEYAKQNLVLVELDFPQSKKLEEKTREQNEKLKGEFKVQGFPTLVLLDAEGKKLGEVVGYVKGGPKAFISKLDEMTKK